MKNTSKALAFSFALLGAAGCTTTKGDPQKISVADEKSDDFVSVFTYKASSGEVNGIIDVLGCTKKWSGAYTYDIHYSRFIRFDNAMDFIRVKPNNPTTIYYSFNNSYGSCMASGTIYAKKGEEYFAYGTYEGNKCTLEVRNNKTREPISFIPAKENYKSRTCTP